MQGLARGGVVSSQRGKRGGFRLAQPVESLSLFDITEAVAPTQVLNACPRGLPEHKEKLCALHQCCRDAMLAFNEKMAATRLIDVIDSPYLAEGGRLPLTL
ncbi:iron-responsive transcriptional regulator [compost metagenome]